MTLLTRLTTDYSETEDRLCLSGVSEDGQVLTLWVTRRLGDRLFPLIVNWLEVRSLVQTGTVDATQWVQSYEQQKAVEDIAPAVPVSPQWSEAASSLLIETVDIAKAEAGVILTFKDRDGREARLALTVTELRQWLSICARGYRKGDWSLDIWPNWLCLDQPPDANRYTSAIALNDPDHFEPVSGWQPSHLIRTSGVPD